MVQVYPLVPEPLDNFTIYGGWFTDTRTSVWKYHEAMCCRHAHSIFWQSPKWGCKWLQDLFYCRMLLHIMDSWHYYAIATTTAKKKFFDE